MAGVEASEFSFKAFTAFKGVRMKTAELIIDTSDKNVDLYHATGFSGHDPYIYFKIGSKKYLMMSDLEVDRARKESRVDTVIKLTKYMEKAKKSGKKPLNLDAVVLALKEKKIKKIVVPKSMPFTMVDFLRNKKFRVEAGPSPFYPARLKKGKAELRHVLDAQRAVFSAMGLAEDMIRKSKIKGNKLFLNNRVLTSEMVRDAISLHLYKKGFISSEGPIVACGNDSIDPHSLGKGPLRPHQSIIVDIFPRSAKTYYWGDATRTFCKGKAPARLKEMYNVVKTAQVDAIKKIRAGVGGQKIHEGILKYFEGKGFVTGEKDGRMQGFFHGTGHGIGLELHEEPVRIKPDDYKLQEGFVTSVEPGLYYKGIGGVRIEDLVYITKKGCKILSKYPKKLEIL